MQILIWSGAAITLLGIAGLLFVGLKLGALKRQGLEDTALKARVQGLLPVNLASLFISAIGLIMVITGIILG